MKKLTLLLLVLALILSLVACANAPEETTPFETTLSTSIACGTEETTVISYTGMDGTFYVYEDQWQDYISGKRDDYEIITTATTPLETTADPYTSLNELMAVPDICIELADGRRYTPYESLVYAQTNSGPVADGHLILRSTENVLPEWVKEGLIPQIYLSEKMTLLQGKDPFAEACVFTFFTRDGDVYTKAATLVDATIHEAYRYGLENFAGKSVYIRFDVKKTTESGTALYAYIFSTKFDETIPSPQGEIWFSEYLPERLAFVSRGRAFVPYIQLVHAYFAEDDEGELFVDLNCLGRTNGQYLQDLLREGVVFHEVNRYDGARLVVDGMDLIPTFEVYDEEGNFVGYFAGTDWDITLVPALDYEKNYYAAVVIGANGRAFRDWQEEFSFALWFKIK